MDIEGPPLGQYGKARAMRIIIGHISFEISHLSLKTSGFLGLRKAEWQMTNVK